MRTGTIGGKRSAKDWNLAFAAFVIIYAAYLLLIHDRGFIASDEGFLNSLPARFAAGEVPHRDFEDKWPGALWALHSLAHRVFGASMEAPRLVLALAGAAALAVLAALARSMMSPALALGALAAAAAWGFPVWFASNATWYSMLLAVAGAWFALLAHGTDASGRGGRMRLLLLGFCSGAALGASLCFKQTTGLLGLLSVWTAFSALEVSRFRPATPACASMIWRGLAGCLLVALPAVALAATTLSIVADRPDAFHALVFAGPSCAVSLSTFLIAFAAFRSGAAGAAFGRLLFSAAAFALGAAAAVLPLAAYYHNHGALGAALHSVFSGQWRLAMRTYMAYRGASLSLAFLLPVGAAAAGLMAGSGKKAVAWTGISGYAAAAIACGFASPAAGMNGLAAYLYASVWNLMFYLAHFVSGAVVARLLPLGRPCESELREPFLLLAAVAAAVAPASYPQSAPMYLAYYLPMYLVLAFFLAGSSTRTAAGRAVVIGAGVLAAAFSMAFNVPSAPGTPGLSYAPQNLDGRLPEPHGRLRVPLPTARAFASVLSEIETRTSAGEPIFSYPDDYGFYFLSERTNPTRYTWVDYSADPAIYQGILDALDRLSVRIVIFNMDEREHVAIEGKDDFIKGLKARYAEVARHPPFAVLERKR